MRTETLEYEAAADGTCNKTKWSVLFCRQSRRETDICPQTETRNCCLFTQLEGFKHLINSTESWTLCHWRNYDNRGQRRWLIAHWPNFFIIKQQWHCAGVCTLSQGLLVEGGLRQRRRFKLADVLRQSVLGGHKWVWQQNDREKKKNGNTGGQSGIHCPSQAFGTFGTDSQQGHIL